MGKGGREVTVAVVTGKVQLWFNYNIKVAPLLTSALSRASGIIFGT